MWLNRLEYKYSRYCIRGLTKYLVIGRIFMYLLMTAFPQFFFANFFAPISRWDLMHGKIWEILTVLITPGASSPLWFLVDAYFFYFIGTTLEQVWGDFKFNVFILFSWVAALLSCFIVGIGTMGYLSTLMFIAFSIYFPTHQMLVFFVLPIQAKYLGWAAGFLLLVSFLSGAWATKVNILLACVALLAFFGKGLIDRIQTEIQSAKRRRAWKQANQRFH